METSKLDRFDQAFLTVFGSIGTMGPLFHTSEQELAKQKPAPRHSK